MPARSSRSGFTLVELLTVMIVIAILATLTIGDVEIRPVKPCARCPIPSIDQATGIPGPDPLDILQTYRANPRMEGAVCLGMNCIVTAGAGRELHLGQELETEIAF